MILYIIKILYNIVKVLCCWITYSKGRRLNSNGVVWSKGRRLNSNGVVWIGYYMENKFQV